MSNAVSVVAILRTPSLAVKSRSQTSACVDGDIADSSIRRDQRIVRRDVRRTAHRGVATRAVLVGLLTSLALTACGGGGGGGSGSTPASPSSNPTSTPSSSAAFSAQSVSLTGTTASNLEVIDESIRITLANAPSAGLPARISLSGIAVSSASINWQSPTEGRLRVVAQSPGSLGAGTYQGTVKVEVCLDAQCAAQASGSPVNIAVSYVVTGSSIPTTQVFWSETLLQGADLTSSETRSPTMSVRISVTNLPPAGMFVQRSVPATGVISSLVFSQPTFSPDVGRAFAQYDVTVRPPASLGSGIFTDSVGFRACFDQACTQEVPNSRYTLSMRLLIPATEGVEFSRRSLVPATGGATNLAWSAATQSLYLASSEFASQGSAPIITQVDPVTMASGVSVSFPGEDLNLLAATDNGAFLYVASKTQPTLHRLPLPSMTPDLQIPLGSSSPYPYLVGDMAPLPGQPQSIVTTLKINNLSGGIRVYDNATARATALVPSTFELVRWLVPGTAAGSFISQSFGPSSPQFNNLETLAVDAGGVHVATGAPIAGGTIVGTRPQRSGNRLFTLDGRILDVSNGALLGALSFPDSTTPRALLVDDGLNRIFVWMEVSQRSYILSYELSTLRLLALAPVYAPSMSPGIGGNMVRWGTNGVALVDGNSLLVLSGPFFTSYTGAPTL